MLLPDIRFPMQIRNHALILALAFVCATSSIAVKASGDSSASHTIDLASNPEDKALIRVPIPIEALQHLSAQLEIPTAQTADTSSTHSIQGLAIKPGWGKYGAGSIQLPQKFPPGNYTIKAILVAPEADSARAALYAVLDNKKQIQIAAARGIPVGQHARINVDIYAPAPFDRIVIKKMDDSPKASAILAALTVVDLKKSEDPHLTAYLQVLRHPAPWGMTNPALASRLASPPTDTAVAEELRATAQRWLDQRSRALDLAAQASDLKRVSRILHTNTLDSGALRLAETLEAHRAVLFSDDALDSTNAVAQGAIATTRATLVSLIADLQKETSERAGGITQPESGSNIVSWIKNWNILGFGEGREFNEPTPWRAAFPDGSTLSFLPPLPTSGTAPPSPAYFESTWTTNFYDTGTHRFYYTILAPIAVVETDTGRIDASTIGLIRGRRDDTAGWFVLRSDNGLLLFIANRKIIKNEFTEGRLSLEFASPVSANSPAALGYAWLPRDFSAPLETTARFYQNLLACQPVQCVQVQRGTEAELFFEYRLRPTGGPTTDTLTPPASDAIAPLPHLLHLWTKTDAGRDALSPSGLSAGDIQTSPGNWPHLANRTILRHTLPSTQAATARHGINVWLHRMKREDYAELARQGCQLIRLTLGTSAFKWDWGKTDEMKALVQNNLKWIHETGEGKIKVYPALFGNWAPDEMHSWKGFRQTPEARAVQSDWLRRWQTIMEWCRPYADIIAYYDLLNEPRVFSDHHDVGIYYAFIRENMVALRQAAGPIPLLVEVANMANPVALSHWEDVGDDNIIVGCHDYWPHMFTHQQVVDPQPVVFYPSFMPMIEWKAPSWRNDNKHWHYWDRWKCDAVSYPVFHYLVKNGFAKTRIDCGEYGVVGYAGKASESGSIWLSHILERFDRLGINHAVWGVQGGYTWPVPAFKQTILDHWSQRSTSQR